MVVLVTAGSGIEGERLARKIVAGKLAACVNLVPKVKSVFRWKGKVETAGEILLIIKTRKSLFSRLEKMVSRFSSYELPEVLALPVEKGGAGYLKWIKSATSRISSV